MWLFELMSWVVVGLGGGALFTGLARERRTRREMRIGAAGAVVAGLLGRLVDSPRPGAMSVVAVLAAVGGAGCALLFDWLNVEAASVSPPGSSDTLDVAVRKS